MRWGPREQAPISVDQPILLAGTMRHRYPVGRRKAVGCSFSASPARKYGNWQPFLDYRQTHTWSRFVACSVNAASSISGMPSDPEGSKVERVLLATGWKQPLLRTTDPKCVKLTADGLQRPQNLNTVVRGFGLKDG